MPKKAYKQLTKKVGLSVGTMLIMKIAKDGNHSDFGRSMADLTSLREVLEDTPTADVVEVRHGKWLTWEEQFPDRKPTKKNNLGVFCNNCHNHADNMTDYCPNCGAKMDGDTNDEL